MKRYRVIRGGSWRFTANFARVSFRIRFTPDYRYDTLGFRMIRGLR